MGSLNADLEGKIMAIKVSKLSKELEVSKDQLIEALQKLYVDVQDGDSLVDDKIAALMRIKMGKAKTPPKEEKKRPTKKNVIPSKTSEEKKSKTAAKKKSAAGSGEEDVEKKKPAQKKRKKPESAEDVPIEELPREEEPAPVTAEKPGIKRLDKVVVVQAAEKKEEKKTIKIKPLVLSAKEIENDREEADMKQKKIKKISATKYLQKKKSQNIEGDVRYVSKIRVKKVRHILKTERRQEIASEDIKLYEGNEFKKIQLSIPSNIRAIAVKVNKRPNDIIQYMMRKGALISINQELSEDIVRRLLKDFGYELDITRSIEDDLMLEHYEEEKTETETRAPIVTFMGHVDHGKTSLLDYIRSTMVTAKEKGGITQHIGAYRVDTPSGSVTFLDTPGHEAFTAMRARGATATDVVVLVVAADDGVMPQTKEAIDHARAAGVAIIVAINKCDLPGANPQKVKMGLQKENLVSEEYGGQTVMVEVSAKTGEGVDHLMEMLMLESELLELKANPALRARGTVIEAKKTSGQGVTATLLVQNGTLHAGDIVFSGIYYGRVKAMFNDRGERIETALPSTPVEMMGLEGVPEAGDSFYVVKSEKKAKTLSEIKQGERKKTRMTGSQRITLEDFHEKFLEGEVKELKIILKADVQGSLEAIVGSLKELSTDEVKVEFIHSMVGDISESDVMLAIVSNAVIIGFHIKAEPKAEALAKSEKIDHRIYDVIYEAINDVRAAMEGLLEPVLQEAFQGTAQVKQIFSSKNSKAAGCVVSKGTIHRKDRIRVKRGGEIIFEGSIAALKRFKDDVKDVREGFECGISVQGLNDVREGDIIEAYIIEKIARRLDSKKK